MITGVPVFRIILLSSGYVRPLRLELRRDLAGCMQRCSFWGSGWRRQLLVYAAQDSLQNFILESQERVGRTEPAEQSSIAYLQFQVAYEMEQSAPVYQGMSHLESRTQIGKWKYVGVVNNGAAIHFAVTLHATATRNQCRSSDLAA